MTLGNIQFDLDLAWASEKVGERHSQLLNHAGTWDLEVNDQDSQLGVAYSDDQAMLILACGDQ